MKLYSYRKFAIPLAFMAGFGVSIPIVANAQTTTSSDKTDGTVTLEKVEVTGTRLSGATVEGALSVSLYKMDDVILQGYSNVGEMLRKKLPQFGGGIGTVNEGFGNGGSGETLVSLRDLPLSRTLFLVNGRRTNADLNLIPKAAVERVEILNDGASAIYGTDAVAGVVNFILKKDYQGAEVTARFANTTKTDISEQRYTMVTGGKVLNTTFTVSFEASQSNSQFSTDRSVSTPSGDSVSGTSNPGLFTPRASSAETAAAAAAGNLLVPLRWYVNPAKATGLTSASQIPSAFNPAVFLTVPNTMSATARNNARNAEEARLNAILGTNSPVLYGGNATLMPGLNPGFPYGYYTLAVRPSERMGLTLNTNSKLTEKIKMFTDIVVSRNQSENNLAPSPLSGFAMGATNYWYNQVFPAAAAADRNFSYSYRPAELGPRITYNEFEETRIVAGLKGEIAQGWDFEVAVMNDLWSLKSVQTGGVYASVYDAALNDGTAGGAFNPYGVTPVMSMVSPVNPGSLIDTFKGSASSIEHQRMRQIDATVRGELFDMPAGPLKAVVGVERRLVRDIYQPDVSLLTGSIFPFNIESAYGYSRGINAGYFETEVPVTKTLALPLAARYEKFSDVGGTGVKPRLAFRWEPMARELTIRGSWAKGFVAPSMGDLDPSAPYQSYTELYNPVTDIRTQATEGSIFQGNPALKPAKSDSYLVGIVYSPKKAKGLTVGMNYYRIKESSIPFTSDQYIVNQWFANGPDSASNPFGANAAPSAANPLGAQVEMNVDGSLYQVRNVGPINTGTRLTDGIDLFANYEFDTSIGRFIWDTTWTRVLTFEMENFPGAGKIDYLGKYWGSGSAMENYGFPYWKGSSGLTWKYRDYTLGLGYNYAGGYKEDEYDNRSVESYQTYDIRASYRIPKIDVVLNVGVNNFTDEQPPYVITSFENQYDRAIGDIRGRVWFVEMSKRF
ncbi:MAG: TonB-dependent receptor [Opitutaceae bacterium]|nr:TonB-dependent receptor [Opitutaceae bacterium]